MNSKKILGLKNFSIILIIFMFIFSARFVFSTAPTGGAGGSVCCAIPFTQIDINYQQSTAYYYYIVSASQCQGMSGSLFSNLVQSSCGYLPGCTGANGCYLGAGFGYSSYHSSLLSCMQKCQPGCDPGLTDCSSEGYGCVDTDSNIYNCGGCGNDCGADICVNGACQPAAVGPCKIDYAGLYPATCPKDASGNMLTDCHQGNTLTAEIGYSGSCAPTTTIQADAYSSDGKCRIQYVSGDIQGVTDVEASALDSAGTRQESYNYSIPTIPSQCNGSNISMINVTFYSDIPAPANIVSDSYLTGLVSNITLHSIGCGDYEIETPEQCDNGAKNSNFGACLPNCTLSYCGDGYVQAPNGNGQNEQCDGGPDLNSAAWAGCNKNICQFLGIPGWTPSSPGVWMQSSTNTVQTVSKSVYLYSQPMDLKVGHQYILSLRIYNPTNCTASADLNNNNCIDGKTWLPEQHCFNANTMMSVNSPGPWTPKTVSFSLTDPYNNATPEGYIKNVQVRLAVEGNGCDPTMGGGVQFDDVSLRDTSYLSQGVYYDNLGTVNSSTACCPFDYCWDGVQCVNSLAWMNDSQKGPVWNLVLDYDVNNWTNNHVNTTERYRGTGYRCIYVDDTNGAQWLPAHIKYDWNYADSGYCNHDTDCFVNQTYQNPDDYNSSCIHNGQSIGEAPWDASSVGTGNHYCTQGNWSTKSTLIARALVNLSQGRPYILLCDKELAYVFNSQDATDNIIAECTIVIKQSSSWEKVITGFVLNKEENANGVGGLLYNIRQKYYDYFLSSSSTLSVADVNIKQNINDCTPTAANPDYLICSNIDNLTIYYNNVSKFFLMSNYQLSTFQPTTWDTIWNFFLRLFGFVPQDTTYALLNYTTNFDKIYILKNNTLNVNGVEETKYDEYNESVLTFLYLNYSGAIIDNATINTDYIRSVIRPLSLNNTLSGANQQELIIKSRGSTGLWPYLAAMLRDRDTPKLQ